MTNVIMNIALAGSDTGSLRPRPFLYDKYKLHEMWVYLG